MRLVYLLTVVVVLVSCNNKRPLVRNIPTATMASVGIDSTIIDKMTGAIRNHEYSNVHSLLITRHGKLVYEQYFTGKDEVWGAYVEEVTFTADEPHDLRSISKSVVSACIGIAIAQGKLKDVNQSVFDFFPELEKYKTGDRANLTIEHLLTMSTGIDWNEDIPYTDPANTERKLYESSNPAEFVLSQPLDTIPGAVWKYNGGATQVLATIIKKVSGVEVDEFARVNLFEPLGITYYEWVVAPGSRIPAAASGLRLRPYDMLKFGLLYYHEGKWDDKQILTPEWVHASFETHIARPTDGGYGYQFWTGQNNYHGKEVGMVAAFGNGVQRIFFNKEADLVVAITAGNYNQWNLDKHPDKLLPDFIYPAIKE